MPIKVQCTSCGAALQAPDHLQGKAVPCPKCKQRIVVGASANPTARAPAQPVDDLQQLLGGGGGSGAGLNMPSGYSLGGGRPQPQSSYPNSGYAAFPGYRKKKPWGLWIGLGSAAVVLIATAIGVALVVSGGDEQQANAAPEPVVVQPADIVDTTTEDDTQQEEVPTGPAPETVFVGTFDSRTQDTGETAETRNEKRVSWFGDKVPRLDMRNWMQADGSEVLGTLAKLPRAGDQIIQVRSAGGQMLVLQHDQLEDLDRDYVDYVIASVANSRSERFADWDEALDSILKMSGLSEQRAKSIASLPAGAPFVPDVLQPLELENPVMIQLGFGSTFERNMILSSDRSVAMLVKSQGVDWQRKTSLFLFDLKGNKPMGVMEFPSSSGVPFGITSNDRGIFSYAQGHTFRNDKKEITREYPTQVEQWELGESGIVHGATVDLGNVTGNARLALGRSSSQVHGLVNDQTVYLVFPREFFLVDFPSGDVVCMERAYWEYSPAFSANRKYMAFQPGGWRIFSDRRRVQIINCEDLTRATEFEAPQLIGMGFSDNGALLAGIYERFTKKSLCIFDVRTGKMIKQLPLPFGTTADNVYWSGNEYVVIAGIGAHIIFDLEKGHPVAAWEPGLSNGTDFIKPLGNRQFLHLETRGPARILHSAEFPAPEWIDSSVTADQFYVDLQGSDVTIDTSQLDPEDFDRDAIQQQFEQWAIGAGANLVNDAELRIVMRKGIELPRKQNYVSENGNYTHSIDYEYGEINVAVKLRDREIWDQDMTGKGLPLFSGTLDEISDSIDAEGDMRARQRVLKDFPVRYVFGDGWRRIQKVLPAGIR